MAMLLMIVIFGSLELSSAQPLIAPATLTGSRSSASGSNLVHYAIDEETPLGTVIGHGVGQDSGFLERLDPTVVSSLRYRFLTQIPNYLEIDEQSGILTTRGRVDREQICTDSVNAVPVGIGSDGGDICQVRVDVAVQPMQYFQIFKVYITIIDINDNDPTFPADIQRRIEIVESAPVGSRFSLPVATDRDSRRYGVQRYSLTTKAGTNSKQDLTAFDLRNDQNPDGSRDVRLILAKSLDRETRAEYHLSLVAYDGGVPAHTATCDVIVVVLDVNDNHPTFDSNQYAADVVENASPGTTVLRVHATDPDIGINGLVRYHLTSGNQANMFAVDDVTGDVMVVGTLDYERASVHHLGLCAIDSGGGTSGPEMAFSADVVVHIRIVDVNDNAPTVTFNTLTASGADVASVAEDSYPGTFISHVIVSDPDATVNGQTHCKLVFDPTSSTGELAPFRLVHLFDAEYQLVTALWLDRETTSWYSVSLTCHDAGTPSLNTTVQLHVDVTDVNDNSPQFFSSSSTSSDVMITYTAELLENNFVGVFVSQLNATDRDVDDNGLVTYLLTDESLQLEADDDTDDDFGAKQKSSVTDEDATADERWNVARWSGDTDVCSEKFDVDPTNGIVTAKISLDYEQQAVYRCRLLAVDNGTPPRTGEARLVVSLVDVNDERPQFHSNLYSFTVDENQPAGSHVGTVSATDADSPPYNQFTYSVLSAGSLSDAFQIDNTSGRISTTRPLDRERQELYHLIIVAKDSKSPDVLTSTTSVNVHISDVNDNSPVFVSPFNVDDLTSSNSNNRTSSADEVTVITVSSQTRAGSVITRVKAVDIDTGNNAQISYTILSEDVTTRKRRFSIDSHSGTVFLTEKLTPSDINSTYQLTVTATDAGIPPLSTTIRICFKVVEWSPGGVGASHLTSGGGGDGHRSRYDEADDVSYTAGLSGFIAVITLTVITLSVLTAVLVTVVCLIQRRRRTHQIAVKSTYRGQGRVLTLSRDQPGGGDKYNCRVEAMRALKTASTVNHGGDDVGVAKSLIRPLDSSPRLPSASSGTIRVTKMSLDDEVERSTWSVQSKASGGRPDCCNTSKTYIYRQCPDLDVAESQTLSTSWMTGNTASTANESMSTFGHSTTIPRSHVTSRNYYPNISS